MGLQHAQVVKDIHKKIMQVVKKKHIKRRNICLLKIRTSGNTLKKDIDFLYVGVPNLWEHLRNGVLQECNEVYEKKRCKRSKVDT